MLHYLECMYSDLVPVSLLFGKDERNQVLIAYLWIRQKWNDAYLRWNKEDYDGLEVIHIPSSLVWRPDLVLYNKYGFTCQSLTNT